MPFLYPLWTGALCGNCSRNARQGRTRSHAPELDSQRSARNLLLALPKQLTLPFCFVRDFTSRFSANRRILFIYLFLLNPFKDNKRWWCVWESGQVSFSISISISSFLVRFGKQPAYQLPEELSRGEENYPPPPRLQISVDLW